MKKVILIGGPEDGREVTVGNKIEEFNIPVLPLSTSAGRVPDTLVTKEDVQQHRYVRVSDTEFGYIGVIG